MELVKRIKPVGHTRFPSGGWFPKGLIRLFVGIGCGLFLFTVTVLILGVLGVLGWGLLLWSYALVGPPLWGAWPKWGRQQRLLQSLMVPMVMDIAFIATNHMQPLGWLVLATVVWAAWRAFNVPGEKWKLEY